MNKELVSAYIEAFYNDKDFDRAGAMLTDDFHNHHPGVGVGRQRTIETFSAQATPSFTYSIQRIIAEDSFVWTHGVVSVAPGVPPVVVVDIWRVADGLLAEHWDVAQAVPPETSLEEMVL